MSFFKAPLLRRLALFKHGVHGVNVCFRRYIYSHQPSVSTFIRTTEAIQAFEERRESSIVHGFREKDAICGMSTSLGDSGYDVPALDFARADYVLFTETVSEDRNIAKSVQAIAKRLSPECFDFEMIITKLDHYLFKRSIYAGPLCHADQTTSPDRTRFEIP